MHSSDRDRRLGNPSGLDIQPTRQDRELSEQLDRLVTAGLLGRESAKRSRPTAKTSDTAKGKTGKKGQDKQQPLAKECSDWLTQKRTVLAHFKDQNARRLIPDRDHPQPARPDESTIVRPQPIPKNHEGSSSLAQLKKHRNSMLAAKGRDTRRERTFIGTSCAVCEEPLEHTLRGEHILQLSCSHVSHEACFYEYIKEFQAQECPTCEAPLGLDTSRGGAIDFDNLNKLVRSAQNRPPSRGPSRQGMYYDPDNTPSPWDTESVRRMHEPQQQQQQQQRQQRQPPQHHSAPSQHSQQSNQSPRRPTRMSREHLLPEQVRINSYQYERTHHVNHTRNESAETGAVSAGDFAENHNAGGRRHDYDLHNMEASLSSPRHNARNPIPAPTVTVRSEFPTLSKSRQQQSLTCLVTVEVVDGKWQPTPEDLRSPTQGPVAIPEEGYDDSRAQRNQQHTSPKRSADSVHEEAAALEGVKDELYRRCENWHGLDFARFGQLLRHGKVRVGKDKQAWQELECYLFAEMLICVKAKKVSPTQSQQWDGSAGPTRKSSKVTLKGSILIKRHLKQVEVVPDDNVLTLSLSVAELPQFHLQFQDRAHLDIWRRALLNLNDAEPRPQTRAADFDHDASGTDEDEYGPNAAHQTNGRRVSSVNSSSYGAGRSQATAPTEYTNGRAGVHDLRLGTSSIHVPLDIVVVIPVSSSMAGLKINVLRDSLRFLVSSLGERDRMGLVSFGSGGGSIPLVGMTNKAWPGWTKAIESIRPTGQKNMRADVVDGANVAVDLLMQRRSSNPLSNIVLISDSSTADHESVDFVVSRAEAAKISIHSFGLGLTHKPDAMVDLSSRTKACYTYVKDWMMLRECLAGCMGSLQSTSHQNVKLKLRLPEGSPAKFVKISGALQITKRATGRDAEASLGDLRFGDKRDILVQLAIAPDTATPENVPTDPWENIISGLEALGGPLESDESRSLSVEELPLIQADLVWGDLLRECNTSQLPRPSLLAITMLPNASKKNPNARAATPPIPPHPHIVQRRMELLTSDMLSRALLLVSRNQADRASHLLSETRSILKGLGKGGLPPLPPPPNTALPPTPKPGTPLEAQVPLPSEGPRRTPSPHRAAGTASPFTPTAGIDGSVMVALDNELESSLEWIAHPTHFSRDSRKAVLQAIGVISSQRAFTFRTPAECLWASRISGVRRLAERSRDWRDAGDESLIEA